VGRGTPASELTTRVKVRDRVMVRIRVRIMFRIRVRVKVRVSINNSGAGESTDKYRSINCTVVKHIMLLFSCVDILSALLTCYAWEDLIQLRGPITAEADYRRQNIKKFTQV